MSEPTAKTKPIELVLFDPRTERPMRATYDAAVITGVQETHVGGQPVAQIVIAGVSAINVDEAYDSLRKRWLTARGDEAVPVAAGQGKRPVLLS
jgi:hypothetical protein